MNQKLAPIIFAALAGTLSALSPTIASAFPVTGCVLGSSTGTVAETCTLVEAAEMMEPGGSETISATSKFAFLGNGYVPIFESASGVPGSAFPTSSNPPGVVGAVSDYVFITAPFDFTLISDGFSATLLASLLAGATQLTPLAADGTTPIVVAEPAEGILNQPVDSIFPSTA